MLSGRLYSLLDRLTGARGEMSRVLAAPGRRCNSSFNAKPGRQLEWLGGFCLLVVLGLEARDCVGCSSDVGFISIGACVATCITGDRGMRHLAYAPGISSAVNPTSFSCIK